MTHCLMSHHDSYSNRTCHVLYYCLVQTQCRYSYYKYYTRSVIRN